jgi:hypothetical protein
VNEHTKSNYDEGGVKYVLLLCCATSMLLRGSAAALAKIERKRDREVRLDDTPIDIAIVAEGTTAEM